MKNKILSAIFIIAFTNVLALADKPRFTYRSETPRWQKNGDDLPSREKPAQTAKRTGELAPHRLIKVYQSKDKIGKYEVTQKEWIFIMGNNPSVNKEKNGDPILTNPVDSVSKAQALKFCEKLTAYERQMGYIGENEKYTLPDKETWYMMFFAKHKAVFNLKYFEDVGWFSTNSKNKSQHFGKKSNNSLMLYDMLGNVAELCTDGNVGGCYNCNPMYSKYSKELRNVYTPDKWETLKLYENTGWAYGIPYKIRACPNHIVGFRVYLKSE